MKVNICISLKVIVYLVTLQGYTQLQLRHIVMFLLGHLIRLFMPEGEHQFVNITLAGAHSPRVASKQGEMSEPYGDEVSRYGFLTITPGVLILSSKLI